LRKQTNYQMYSYIYYKLVYI